MGDERTEVKMEKKKPKSFIQSTTFVHGNMKITFIRCNKLNGSELLGGNTASELCKDVFCKVLEVLVRNQSIQSHCLVCSSLETWQYDVGVHSNVT